MKLETAFSNWQSAISLMKRL